MPLGRARERGRVDDEIGRLASLRQLSGNPTCDVRPAFVPLARVVITLMPGVRALRHFGTGR
jgi:hypothetical protein